MIEKYTDYYIQTIIDQIKMNNWKIKELRKEIEDIEHWSKILRTFLNKTK